MNQVWTIFRREFATYFATPLAYVFIIIFLFAMGAFTFYIGNFYGNGVADLTVFFGYHTWLYLFLVPAIAHQDPHYHRMPNASYPRRALHAITAVLWAQSDYGLGMPNYSNLVTTVVGDGLGNLYVPGRQKSWGSAAGPRPAVRAGCT